MQLVGHQVEKKQITYRLERNDRRDQKLLRLWG